MCNKAYRRAGVGMLICVLVFFLTAAVVWAAGTPVWPKSGSQVGSDGNLTVDYTNCSDGYVIVHAVKSQKKMKLRLAANDQTLDFDLNQTGADEVFPLHLGEGTYTVTLYKNVQGKSYSQDGRVSFKVAFSHPYAPDLCPNQQINYTEKSDAVKTSNELCAKLTSDQEKFDAICKFISKQMMYDYIKSLTVKSGTLPDIDGCFKSRMGICQDLSAITVCMLRVQGIPARMMVGKVDTGQHAWVTALVDGEWQFYDPTVATNGLATPKSYTVEKYF